VLKLEKYNAIQPDSGPANFRSQLNSRSYRFTYS